MLPRALSLLGGCCDIDKCNIHDPEKEPTEPPGYVRTTIPSSKLKSSLISQAIDYLTDKGLLSITIFFLNNDLSRKV